MRFLVLIAALLFAMPVAAAAPGAEYYSRRPPGRLSGGVRMIPIHTPAGDFRVWTQRIGNNPRLKVLLLHGGPAATHEYFEAFQSFFPGEGIEFYYYDQLGSAYSTSPMTTGSGRSRASSMRSSRSASRSA